MNRISKWVVLYLAGVAAFAPFSTDIYLAAMPTIQHLFHASGTEVQLTLALFFVCFAVMQLVWGPLSDRFGRKPILIIGIGVFMIGSLGCALSQSIDQLLLFRMLQGVGACAGAVLSLAMVRDIFEDQAQLAKVLSMLLSVSLLAPVIAPIVGSYLLVHFGWRSNFYFLDMYGAILFLSTWFLQESYPKATRHPLPASQLLSAYWQQICCKRYVLMVFAVACNFSVMFAFIASSSFIYIRLFQIPAEYFGYYFAVNASALIIGALSLTFLKRVFTGKQVIQLGVSMAIVGAIIMLLSITLYPQQVLSIVIPSFFITYGVGLLFPETTSLALQHVVKYNGIASSLLGTGRFSVAALTAALMGMFVHTQAWPLPVFMLCLAVATALFIGWFYRGTAK